MDEGIRHRRVMDFVWERESVAMEENEKRKRRKHAAQPTPSRPRSEVRQLYHGLFSSEERAALEGAAEGNDLDQEVDLLRVLIRRGVADGVDLETLSRSLGRLAQMLRVRHVIRGDAAKSLDEALARVLEEIGNEVGG